MEVCRFLTEELVYSLYQMLSYFKRGLSYLVVFKAYLAEKILHKTYANVLCSITLNLQNRAHRTNAVLYVIVYLAAVLFTRRNYA